MFYIHQNCGIIPTQTQQREFTMNKKHFLTSSLLFIIMFGGLSTANANHIYANNLSINKITGIQDSIVRTAMHNFGRTPTAVLNQQQRIMSQQTSTETSTSDMYGHTPIYGSAPIYGEYEAHEFAGRSGGESELNDIKSLQLGYSHYDTKLNFDNFERTSSDYDLIMLGLTDGNTQLMNKNVAWAIYAGAIDGTTTTSTFNIDEIGGYAGLYGRFDMNNFGLAVSINGGAIQNDVTHQSGTYSYTNMWATAGVNTTYNINLDNTFVLQPGIYLGYTWIKSEDYYSKSGSHISNSDANVFEVSPSLHAIKHIDNNWYGTAHIRYAKFSTNNNEIIVDGTRFDELIGNNFVEYGLTLEKSVERLSFSGTILRRDLGQDGWGGNINIKYIF